VDLTEEFLNKIQTEHPDLILNTRHERDCGCCSGIATSIHHSAIDQVTDELMSFIADVLATLIDAGSEREVVEENEGLRDAIRVQVADFASLD
jgi:hypothetical protein